MNQSTKWNVNSSDIERWLKNAGVFLAPLALIYLAPVAIGLQNGFSWSLFVPDQMIQGAMALYLVNVVMDFFRKLSSGPVPNDTTPIA